MSKLRRALLSPYHYLWALYAGTRYGFPARDLFVIGVTGTKGKSSVAEMVYKILEESGHKTALAGTIRFAIGEESRPNRFKMTLPGRGFIQKFLAEALQKGCTYAVIEITSEAALQHRHLFLDMNVLVFTNLEPEHIESHGSLEKYFNAKFRIGEALATSPKRPRAIVASSESEYGKRFLALPVEEQFPFSLANAEHAAISDKHVSFDWGGQHFDIPQPGAFSVLNALAAIKAAQCAGVSLSDCARALANLSRIPGRAERVEAGQSFDVIVDYAHTPGSLTALYEAFKDKRKIAVLGNTGGGRDTWKRPLMGNIAELYCDEIILTNEDPYDEDPKTILDQMAAGMHEKTPQLILDRREAIRAALHAAHPGDVILITGKGTDPFIMGARGAKQPWSDASVAREELERLLSSSYAK